MAQRQLPEVLKQHQFQTGHPGGPGRPKSPSKMEEWKAQVEAEFHEWVKPYVNARNGDDQALAMKASEFVMDRLYGKAMQPLEHSGQVQLETVLFADSLPAPDPLELESVEVDD